MLVVLSDNPFYGVALLGPYAGVLLVQFVLFPVYPDLIANFDVWVGSIMKGVFG